MITGSSDANYFYSIFGVKGAKGVDGMRYTPSTDTAVLSMGSCTYTFSGSSGLSSNCAISAGKRANPIAFADMTNAVYTALKVVTRYISPMAQAIPVGGAGKYGGTACNFKFVLATAATAAVRSEEHTSELQSLRHLV